jgi:hypothetical protein
MITARQGFVAVYKGKSKYSKSHKEWVGNRQIELSDGEHLFEKDVMAWDDEGEALVLGDRGLELASNKHNFVGVREGASSSQYIAMIPAGDWVVWRTEGDTSWSSRLCAWGLKADGSVVPLEPDDSGLVMETEDGNVRHISEGPPPKEAKEAQSTAMGNT